jgi:hypothetical protein
VGTESARLPADISGHWRHPAILSVACARCDSRQGNKTSCDAPFSTRCAAISHRSRVVVFGLGSPNLKGICWVIGPTEVGHTGKCPAWQRPANRAFGRREANPGCQIVGRPTVAAANRIPDKMFICYSPAIFKRDVFLLSVDLQRMTSDTLPEAYKRWFNW